MLGLYVPVAQTLPPGAKVEGVLEHCAVRRTYATDDFVPCYVYRRELDYERRRRGEALPSDRVLCRAAITTVTTLIMSLNSHAHFIDTDTDDERAREHLFGHLLCGHGRPGVAMPAISARSIGTTALLTSGRRQRRATDQRLWRSQH